jgi:predicted alpha/beta hydrolase family esterase
VGVAFDIIELMRNALILHGTDADHGSNWLPWLESKLHKLGYTVWVPDLPRADHPDIRRYNEYLLNHSIKWEFSNDSIIIGHSSGAVEILGLLNDAAFPENVQVKACFLIGAFKGDLGWESLKGMSGDFNFALIKQRCSKFVFIHSDNDPYCPIEDARDLCEQASGKFIELPGQGHFTASLDPKYEAFPELFEIIKKELGQ